MESITKVFSDLVKPYIDTKDQEISTALSNHERQNAKNMCVNNILKGITYRGLTFTPHEDGSITINGTSTGAAYIDITLQTPTTGYNHNNKRYSCEELGLDITKPVFQSTGNDSATTGTGISLRLYCYESKEATSALGYFGSGNSSVKNIADTYPTTKYVSFGLGASEGHIANNVTVYPILYYNSELDKSYVPYAKSNRQLTKDANYLVDNTKFNGAVNMCKNNATTQIINGITFTVNDDGTVTADGTATANADLDLNPGFIEKANVLYRLSGGPSGGSQSTWLLYERNSPNALDTGDGVLFSRTEDVTASVRIRIYAGQTVSNLIFKPMISVASYDGDYVPYAKSNKELTDDVNNLFGRFGQNFKLIDVGSISNSSKTITVNTTIAGLLATYHSGNAEAYESLHMVSCTPTEVPVVKTIASASNVTLDLTQAGKITVTNSGSGGVRVYLLLFRGTATIS